MTVKKNVIEKMAIASLLVTVSLSTSLSSDHQIRAGFQIDTMEMCKSYEVDGFDYRDGHFDNCVSVFNK